MNRDQKLSVLESLLERVRKRAAGPRTVLASAEPQAASTVIAASIPSFTDARAPVEKSSSADGAVAPTPPPSPIHLEPPPRHDEPRSEPPLLEPDEDEGPPSAPRLREGIASDEEQEQDFQDDEGPIQTPPPESGRQHVAAQVAPDPEPQSADELEMDIAITVAETTPEPSQPSLPEEPRAPAPPPDLGIDMGPLPRLAFVSEPEIELHVRPHAPPARPEPPVAPQGPPPPSAVVPLQVEYQAPPIPEPPAAPEPTAVEPLPEPIAAVAPPEPIAAVAPQAPLAPPSAPPPVRLMAQAGPETVEGTRAAPVEVWASTHAPAALRGQVASFVGQNASFVPSSFGDLLAASLELGES